MTRLSRRRTVTSVAGIPISSSRPATGSAGSDRLRRRLWLRLYAPQREPQSFTVVVPALAGLAVVGLLLAVLYLLVTVVLVRRLHEPRERSPGETGGLALVRGIVRLLGVRILLAAWLLSAVLWVAVFALYGGCRSICPPASARWGPAGVDSCCRAA